MTDVTGRCFLSYRRTRSAEAALLVHALHDLGVPVWQDTSNLDSEPSAEALRAAIRDPTTASGLLWITSDVESSSVMRKVEVPELVSRRTAADGFFIQPVAAGGLDYAEAGVTASRHLGVEDLAAWNLDKADGDPVDAAEAARIAELVLRRRLKETLVQLHPGEPIRLCLQTRARAPFRSGTALTLDWSDRFDGRCATAGSWDDRLLPALAVVAATLRELAPDHPVEASGQCALPAALALGAAFVAPAGTDLRWIQRRAGSDDQRWSLRAAREPAEIQVDTLERDASSQDMAVIASINHDVEEALRESRGEVPVFRGFIRLRGPDGTPADLRTPGEALDAAHHLVDEVKRARHVWRDIRRIHVFLAGPAGFAVLLGQLLNGLGPIQTYEHLPTDAIGSYCRAALLHVGA